MVYLYRSSWCTVIILRGVPLSVYRYCLSWCTFRLLFFVVTSASDAAAAQLLREIASRLILNFDPTVPPSFDPSAAGRIIRIILERNTSKKSKKVAVVPGVQVHPTGLERIHLRDDPLPQLSIEGQVFFQNRGARNIIKRCQRDMANYKPKFQSQPINEQGLPFPPIRSRAIFVDDSDIESDGEGGEIP